MLAGHDDEALFVCPNPGCVVDLTRDIPSLHTRQDTPATRLGLYRVCPMPRCCFRIHAWRKPLDEFRTHILELHDQERRKTYAGLLRDRCYEPVAVDPLCAHRSQSHETFQLHLLRLHRGMSSVEADATVLTHGNMQAPSPNGAADIECISTRSPRTPCHSQSVAAI